MNKSEPLLELSSPWMNAAGFMGYSPQQLKEDAIQLGGFVTNPISMHSRTPAHNRAILPYPGGYLIHTGHPNPGLSSVLKHFQQKWERLALPIWPHLLAQTPWEVRQMVEMLEGIENISAVEIGLPPGISNKEQQDILQAAMGELPVYVSIPLDMIETVLPGQLSALGAAGMVLSAPRGMILHAGKNVTGRLFGPALNPLLMRTLCDLRGFNLPIIAGTGIFSVEQGEAALAMGASALQIDLLCWRF